MNSIYKKFYNCPYPKIPLIGVIGTYGKTTIKKLINQWKKAIHNSITKKKNLKKKSCTSLNSICLKKHNHYSIQKNCCYAIRNKIDISVLELSSDALVQNKISPLYFESVIFTNLTNNNSDNQKNMFQKEKIKFSFLNRKKIKTIILNGDDNIANYWIKKFKNKNIISVTTLKKNNIFNTQYWINATKIIYNISKTKIIFNSSWGSGSIYSSLLGDFNITNLLLAMAAMLSINYSLKSLIRSSQILCPIHRKMEKIKNQLSPLFVINNINAPQILYRVLSSFSHYNHEKIWCILGYQKIKDISERKIIGKIVEQFSDFIILIYDFSQKERIIIHDIIKNCNKKNKFFIFSNIKKTMQFIFSQANKCDIILISEKENQVKKIINYIKNIFNM